MKRKLSGVMITKNAEGTIGQSLKSLEGLADEIIIVDDHSTDRTTEIARKFKAKIYDHQETDYGKQKQYAIEKTSGDWILILDSDEIVSEGLREEIYTTLNPSASFRASTKHVTHDAYLISFQNHFFGKQLKHGGEDYKKLIFFKRDSVKIDPALVHEKFESKSGNIGVLKNKMLHYSYRSLPQMFAKFTDYGIREARQKHLKGEKSSLVKVFLYPPHMFWARFIKDKGYRDGFFRIPLDLGFAYIEFLTYVFMLCLELRLCPRSWVKS